MLIQITKATGEVVETITVERIPTQDVIVYWPCWYCGDELVKMPRKFCCNSHRVLYCVYKLGTQN